MKAARDFWKSFTIGTDTLWFFGIVSVLTILALKFGGMSTALTDLGMFLSGGVHEIARMQMNIVALPVLFAVLALDFIACPIVSIALPKRKGRHPHKTEIEKNVLKFFFCVVLEVGFEEVVFRWLPFGLLTKIHFLSGTAAFYCLLLVVNAIFALAHMIVEDERDRQIHRVLRHFISGILWSYVFIKYGLAASILVHFSHNAIGTVLLWLHTEER
jgi:hypothetical protein